MRCIICLEAASASTSSFAYYSRHDKRCFISRWSALKRFDTASFAAPIWLTRDTYSHLWEKLKFFYKRNPGDSEYKCVV